MLRRPRRQAEAEAEAAKKAAEADAYQARVAAAYCEDKITAKAFAENLLGFEDYEDDEGAAAAGADSPQAAGEDGGPA